MSNTNFGAQGDYKVQRREISRLTLKLRQLRPEVETIWTEPADWVIKDANIHGEPVRSLTITLTPKGCEWASRGGCTMCGEFEGSTKGLTVPSEFHIAQFASAVSKYIPEHHPAWLRIYQEGNYTNRNEMEYQAQLVILRLAGIIGGIRRITIESKASCVTKDSVQALRKAVPASVELEVGMGFESANAVVRNVCVNKGESMASYRRALEFLRGAGIRSLAYVLLKPPFLSESESIEDATSTVQTAHTIGFDAISLEPVSIHGYTLVHALYEEGLYQLPWLWSVVKVAQSATNIPDFRIGGVGFYPRPSNVAYNRHSDDSDGCNETLWAAIREYGKSRRLEVLSGHDCVCKEAWEHACRLPLTTTLRERIDEQLSRLDVDRYARIVTTAPLTQQAMVRFTTAVSGGTQYHLLP